jgi:hypothetical protein
MISEDQLLDRLFGNAFRASNGDYAWQRADLDGALESLSAAHYAILSGEVWVVEGNLFCPLSPVRAGGWALHAWETPQREDYETWGHFAHRTAEESLRAIHDLNPEESVPPEIADKLYYHICFTDEATYQPLKHAAA